MNPTSRAQTAEVDELLTVLAHRHSRAAVSHFVSTADDVVTLDDLADALDGRLAEDRKTIAVRLHHVALPRLEEAGLLEYDPRSHRARYLGDEHLESVADLVIE